MEMHNDLQRIIPDPIKRALSKRDVILGIISIILFVTCLSLSAALAISLTRQLTRPSSSRQVGPGKACTSADCLQAAARMRSFLDLSVDPCQDFYSYACGGWVARSPVHPDRTYRTVSNDIYERNIKQLRDVLSKPIKRNTSQSYERKVKYLYQQCVHDYERQKEGGDAIIKAAQSDLGGWYLIAPDTWRKNWTMRSALLNLHTRYVNNIFFNVDVVEHPEDPDRNSILIRKGYVRMHHMADIFEDDKHANQFRQYIGDMAGHILRDSKVKFNDSMEALLVNSFVDDVFTMEKFVSNATREQYSRYDANEQAAPPLMTITALQQAFDQIDWKYILTGIFTSDHVTDATEVYVVSAKYLRKLNGFLANMNNGTKDRMLNNYMIWRLMDEYVDKMSWQYVETQHAFIQAVMYESELPAMWERCFQSLRHDMHNALSALYVKEHTTADSIQEVRTMYQNIKTELIRHINNSLWMDTETKDKAFQKVQAMEAQIGHPVYLDKDKLTDRMYSALVIKPSDSYLQNCFHLHQFSMTSLKNKYAGHQSADFDWGPRTYLPYVSYSQYLNQMVIPSGVAQVPLFSQALPECLNYGVLGYDISSRIISAINKYGRFIGKDGTPGDWWSNKTLEQYSNVEQCLVDYYSNLTAGPYLVDGQNKTIPVNGKYHSWAAFLDQGGLTLSYDTYRRSHLTSDVNGTLPGLGLSHDQAFFISVAQSQCFNERSSSGYYMAKYGFYQEDLRINGAMSNSEEFSRAFHCPRTSIMNAKRKCKVI